jgi:hypothetical protein
MSFVANFVNTLCGILGNTLRVLVDFVLWLTVLVNYGIYPSTK